MYIISKLRYLKCLFLFVKRDKKLGYTLKEFNDYYYLRSKGVETKMGYVTLIGKPIIQKYPNSIIKIDKEVLLISDINGNVAGISHPIILATLNENAQIILKKGCGLSGATVCAATKIEIGEGVGIGANVSIYDTDFHPLNPYQRKYFNNEYTKTKEIRIDDYSWIGGNSIILKGVSIGKGAVVGAGSVITSDIPELTVFGGNPGKFIKKIPLNNEDYNTLFLSHDK